ncbi:MAG: glycine zipper 2TM domain-containing protein [Sphingomonadaceae bacterium]|nr:glycine zipper 2TM domain-containing protein [Sphingomonadaceae bacterium]
MTARRLLSLSIASCTAFAATSALAQPEMTYEPGQYDYARPAPPQAPVIYQQQPVVQQVPVPHVSQPVVQPIPQGYVEEAEYEVEEVYTQAPHHAYPHHAQPYPQPYPAHHAGPAMPPQPAFDREAWLDQCRAQYRDYRDNRGRRDGGIGGGILGAAVGGVIGNRVADGDRLAGTLIGAGVGGIAGAVLGSVIGGSGDRRREARAADECEAWLDRYMAGGYGQQGHYGYPGYGYGYAMHMTYVPVLVAIPQRAVVRETVTEEWVETQKSTYVRPAKKVHYQPAPATAPRPAKGKTRYAK